MDSLDLEILSLIEKAEFNILKCHDISGEDSYMLKIRTDSPASLRRLRSRIRGLRGVERTVTSISLCTIKESGGAPLQVRPIDDSAKRSTQGQSLDDRDFATH
jgi:DNA-binding Lrp family transcriptional regulator